LESHQLILERKIKWVQDVQKTCYRLNRERLSRILRKFAPHIEAKQVTPIPSLSEIGESLFSDLDIGEKK
jgi:hypothetical protein